MSVYSSMKQGGNVRKREENETIEPQKTLDKAY